MRVLVTGGAGYIGSHTTKVLARAGFEPVVLDNLSTGHRWAVRWGTMVEGDLTDRALIRAILREYRVEAVIHFAASAHVGESMQEPGTYFQNNVVNSLNLLDAMHDAGVTYIVFSSTCATYGTPVSIPIAEDHQQHPVNPYGESKLFVERVLRWYEMAYGLRWIALRYFNAAGADPDGDIGEAHAPETHMIPLTIQAALGQRPYIEIFGNDYPTPDGTAIRDYVHVLDLAEGHTRALQHLSNQGLSLALNLGSGRGYSVREVIAAVQMHTPQQIPIREAGRRAGDPAVLVADARRAAEVLQWAPRYSSLASIVGTAWQWHAARHS